MAGLRIEHIAEDEASHLWFATVTNGVSRFDGETFSTFTQKDGLSSNSICCIAADLRGNVWFGGGGGVSWYDGHEFHRLDLSAWGEDYFIVYLALDRDGRIWMAGGLNRNNNITLVAYYDGHYLTDLSQQFAKDCDTPFGICWGIAPDDDGRIWFGMGQLICYDGHRFQSFAAEQGLPASSAVAQSALGGPLWVGGEGTLGRFDGRVYTPVETSINGYVRKIQSDHQGRIWVCTS